MQQRSFVLALLLCLPAFSAREEQVSCGTHAENWREEVQLHRASRRAGIARQRPASALRLAGERTVAGVSVRADAGNIAILDDTAGVVARRNPFNLDKRTVRFIPSSDVLRYRYEVAGDTYDSSAALAGSVLNGIGDDDTREVPLPFPFPFFGQRYTSVFINSDGNVSFGKGDKSITDRSLGRFTAGVPRIGALFEDLDPTRAPIGITVSSAGDRFVVSWVQVPEYSDAGTGRLQTFQLRLAADGLIEVAWSAVTSQSAVIGISRGFLRGSTAVVSFLNTPADEYDSTIAERFTSVEEVDTYAAAQRFFMNHEDSYDYLVFFNSLNIEASSGAVALETTVRSRGAGFGDVPFDTGADAGSPRRLQALLNMGPLRNYPADPNGRVPLRLSTGDTPLTVLGHEAGHLFLALASVRDPAAPNGTPMLNSTGVHWALTYNSDASLLEGHRIQDNGPGAVPRFLTVATVEGFSPLDQYLMGLRAPSDVPDTFYVANAGRGVPAQLPVVGASWNGDRRDVNINQLISAIGRRVPDHTVAQNRFRFAFVLITSAGQEPSPEDLQRLEVYRSSFEAFYSRATSGLATADATLKRAITVSTWPAAGVLTGRRAPATISLGVPPATPLTILLRSVNGAVGVPASITIPAGATSASFEYTGARIGTDTLIVEPVDPQYETVFSRVAVRESSDQIVTVVAGNNQVARAATVLPEPVRIRVTDVNDIPYPGVPVTVAVTGGGSVDRTAALTDVEGIATFRWTPGSEPVQELRVTPGAAGTVVTALTRPSVSANGFVSAASFAPGLTPGGIATIFGSSLGGSAVEVLVNGAPAPVFFSNGRQVNFLVPATTQAGTAEVVIRTPAGTSEPFRVPVQLFQPGIFFDSATGYGAILIGGTGLLTQVRPATAAETLEIYATGLGPVSSTSGLQPTDGQPTEVQPLVTIGGVAAEVIYSGLAPNFPGLYQVNARVPAGLAAGPQALSITASGQRSNEVRVAVR